jgi:DNA-binding GntR family transcriptional regulator
VTHAGRQPRALRSTTLADEATAELRDRIINGELRPGEIVTHEALAESLGISTMPVRESLLRLSHEGFIEVHKNRSYRVRRLTRQDIIDVHFAHATIAGELAARACTNVTPEFLETLRVIEDSWRIDEVEAFEAANAAFHRLINHQSDSRQLRTILRNCLVLMPGHFYTEISELRRASKPDHHVIIEMLAAANPVGARDAAAAHVRNGEGVLLDYLQHRGYWS